MCDEIVNKKYFTCTICSQTFSSFVDLNEHSFTHLDDTNVQKECTYKCEVCYKRFSTSDYLRSHSKIHGSGTLSM
jgi:uncharacterized Zn-finger protein